MSRKKGMHAMGTRFLTLAALTLLCTVPVYGIPECSKLEAEECALAHQLLAEALEIVKKTEDWDGHRFLVGEIADAYGRIGDIEKAIEIAKLADKATNLTNVARGFPAKSVTPVVT